MSATLNLVFLTFRWALRDRLLHMILGAALLLFLLVPVFSTFSMRQVQELSITLSLSAISFTLLVLSILLGASAVWRDVERRYTASVLSLPISRSSYVLGKFLGASFLLVTCSAIMGLASLLVIAVSSTLYPSDLPIHWGAIMLAVIVSCMKYILLATIALLFSCISTSFFLPFFGTVSIFLAGSASQEVYEYVSGEMGRTISPFGTMAAKGLYYVLPNLSAFNFQVNAIYALEIPAKGLLYTTLYFLVYTSMLLCLATWVFGRRELP
jgi:ABC-type transport system involved in multi-copper enzyme maturation permease subunit